MNSHAHPAKNDSIKKLVMNFLDLFLGRTELATQDSTPLNHVEVTRNTPIAYNGNRGENLGW
jgi:predicted ATPase